MHSTGQMIMGIKTDVLCKKKKKTNWKMFMAVKTLISVDLFLCIIKSAMLLYLPLLASW